MPTLSDLQSDLAAGPIGRIQAVFRALVGFPDEAGDIDGASPPDLLLALSAACTALTGDGGTMPDGFCDLLVAYGAPLARGATYADAVIYVAYNQEDWRLAFETHCAGPEIDAASPGA